MALMTQRNQVLKSVRFLVILDTKLPKRCDMVDMKSVPTLVPVFFVGDTTVAALMVVFFDSFLSLLIP